MEPNAATSLPKLPNFSGKKGSSPPFTEWQLRLVSQCRDKGIHEALLPIPEGLNPAKTLAYHKADNSVYNVILSNISGDALSFASQNFGVKEDTAADAYLGYTYVIFIKLFGGLSPYCRRRRRTRRSS